MPIDWGIVNMTLVDNFPEIQYEGTTVSLKDIINYMENSNGDSYFGEWVARGWSNADLQRQCDLDGALDILVDYFYPDVQAARDAVRGIFLHR